jgi:hypothetical protein
MLQAPGSKPSTAKWVRVRQSGLRSITSTTHCLPTPTGPSRHPVRRRTTSVCSLITDFHGGSLSSTGEWEMEGTRSVGEPEEVCCATSLGSICLPHLTVLFN